MTRWRSWVYLPGTGSYGELSDGSMADHFRPEPGRAWWLISKEAHRVSTAPIAGKSIPTNGQFGIELAAESWNMIGCPYSFPVFWDSISVDTLSMAEAVRDTVIGRPWRWDKGWDPDVVALEPFDGCWVYNHEDHPVTLNCMMYLGNVYLEQGRMKVAEPLMTACLDKCRRTLGKDHYDT